MQKKFPVTIRGVAFVVTCEYSEEDRKAAMPVSAVPDDCDTDWLAFLEHNNHDTAEMYRQIDNQIAEWIGTGFGGFDDEMDAYHDHLDAIIEESR